MKNYQTPRAESLEVSLQDILTTSLLGDLYNADGIAIDKINWTDLF